jgi:hypothetical protein
MSSDHHSKKRKDDCCDEVCSGDTVIITFTSNVDQFPIIFSDFAGSVGPCQALLTPGNSVTPALQCLFKQGFDILAFTSRSNPEVTYTLRRC